MQELILWMSTFDYLWLVVLVFNFYLLFVVKKYQYKMEAQIEALQKAPILRQYVEKCIPVDVSDEAQERMEAAMAKQARAFNDAYGLGDLDGSFDAPIKVKESDNIKPEDTV